MLYIADLASLGWENGEQIEVGEWEEERSVLFWAQSVEELPVLAFERTPANATERSQ